MNVVVNWLKRHFSDPQVAVLAVVLLLGILLVAFLGKMLAPVFAAMVIAYLLEGIVQNLQRFRVPRIVAVTSVWVAFVTFLVVLLLILIPQMVSQAVELAQSLPRMIARGQQWLTLLPERYPELISKEQIDMVITQLGRESTTWGQKIIGFSVASITSVITLIIYLILVPLMIFFLLKDKTGILNWIRQYLPKDRSLTYQVMHDVDLQIGNYVRGKFWEILIVWTVTFITFKALNLEYAMLLSVFVGLSVLLPYIGATIMYIPITIVAVFQWGWGVELLWVLVAYSVIQLLDGNVLATILFSEVTSMHPIAVIAAVLVFGGIWGFWGLFFAIPLATLVHAVIKAWPRADGAEVAEAIKN